MPIVRQVCAILALAIVAGCHVAWSGSSSPEGFTEEGTTRSFADEGDAEATEEDLAEGRAMGPMAVRMRLQTRSLNVSQARLYERVEWQPLPDIGAFLLTERDPGERRWADFRSAHLRWDRGPVAVVAGDLRPGFAQGLVFSRTTGRGGVPSASPRQDSKSLGYRSSGENAALRGLCLRLKGSGLEVAGVAGQLGWDARIREDGSVSSLPESGLHVSPNEIASRDRLRGRVWGLRLLSMGAKTHLGLVLQRLQFDRSVDLRRPGRSPIEFHGCRHWLVATDIRHEARSWRGFADLALAPSGEWAGVGGVRTSLSRLRLSALARHYSPGFHSFFGGAASAAGMDDETGVLVAVRGRGWEVYVDEYYRAQRTYTHPLPGPTQVWGAEAHRRLGAAWSFHLAQQQRRKPRWSNSVAIRERDRRTRADLVWGRTSGPQVRLRGEVRHVVRTGARAELGHLHSARCRWRGRRMDWTAHITRFSTPSYDSRIYEYERSLPGTVSIPPLYGQGWRATGSLEITWTRGRASFRYRYQQQARWHRPQRQFGVQLDFVAGHRRP